MRNDRGASRRMTHMQTKWRWHSANRHDSKTKVNLRLFNRHSTLFALYGRRKNDENKRLREITSYTRCINRGNFHGRVSPKLILQSDERGVARGKMSDAMIDNGNNTQRVWKWWQNAPRNTKWGTTRLNMIKNCLLREDCPQEDTTVLRISRHTIGTKVLQAPIKTRENGVHALISSWL